MTTQHTDAIARLAGPATVIADHSWPGTSTTVLRLRTPGGSQLILKTNTNEVSFHRELHALTHWAPALHPHAPRLLDADEEQRHLLMTAVAGQPVNTLSLPPDEARQVHRQAGRLMRALHEAAPPTVLTDFGRQRAAYIRPQLADGATPLTATESTLAFDALALLEELGPQTAVPSHLDFTSRNLLWQSGLPASRTPRLGVIDFETSRYEAAGRDFLRITQRTLRINHDLRQAFFSGYGRNPTPQERYLMHICGVADAAAITVSATQAGNSAFATEARGVLHDALRRWPPNRPA
ncbi:aminoglycoside phosphotransferase family protein [Streptomyces syringium]|uniref:aminoglycoside phosphotransferase family protein n=1 Tax=Streptomyces syringium TaxID=76729 RepID=UPI0034486E32